ncbi:hypothetical protein CBER1_10293 [Cercospora berteroae]|uniref:Protein kinase domain-containing protein n=1 Tax=Cercospora berteroae TaxID=357750 RepID=A0A2S6CN92_9PEZI|nr:hypothetical protein CBER1_10293 [Cercospora berteroae]
MQKYRIGSTGLWFDIESIGAQRQRRPAWQRYVQSLPRWARCAVTGLLVFCATLGFLRGCRDLHDQAIKQYPTDYSKLQPPVAAFTGSAHSVRFSGGIARPQRFVSGSYNEDLQTFPNSIDERYAFIKALASGKEGKAALYHDRTDGSTVVVKIFYSISRNRLPPAIVDTFANFTTMWPAEIEASMLLGTRSDSDFVPVVDYFILQTPSGWFWALVTPFIARVTLAHLAEDERTSTTNRTIDEIDALYRPTFDAMLNQLQGLHSMGYCHDDVKPDNIFVDHPHRWLLGDLGNVRHTDHPWHSTKSWIRQNQWSDCTVNDLRRAYKSYLWFLRHVGGGDFDRQFWDGKKDWSRMYWRFMERWVSLANGGDKSSLHYRAQAILDETFADHASIEIVGIVRSSWFDLSDELQEERRDTPTIMRNPDTAEPSKKMYELYDRQLA